MTARKPDAVVPCCDKARRTCLRVHEGKDVVKYIPLDVTEGLRVLEMPAKEFARQYSLMDDYPADRACQLYLGYSRTIGATEEALNHLGRVITITNEEFIMATTKKAAAAASKPVAKAKPAPKTEKPATKVPKVKTEKAAPKAKGEKKQSAAQLFQDLIMAGKLTDDQIFAKVQAEFGLDDSKKGYVKWYRNHLKKNGKNPPEAK